MKTDQKRLWSVIAVDLALWLLGIVSTHQSFADLLGREVGIIGFGFAIAAAALWTFVAFFQDHRDVRTAFTAAFLTLYLGLVAGSMVPGVATEYGKSGGLLQSVWHDVSTVMLVIVGFYFGGKAVEGAASARAKGQAAQPKAQVLEPTTSNETEGGSPTAQVDGGGHGARS